MATVNTAAASNNKRGIGYTMRIGIDTAVLFTDYEVPSAPQFIGTTLLKESWSLSLWKSDIYPAIKNLWIPVAVPISTILLQDRWC